MDMLRSFAQHKLNNVHQLRSYLLVHATRSILYVHASVICMRAAGVKLELTSCFRIV
uniref:Uncharacterized protein n=1 Tax=Setaria italica TaxID=4555 RepID=K4A3Z1_SETIT